MCLGFFCKARKPVIIDKTTPFERTVPNDAYHPGCYKCAYCKIKTKTSLCLRTYPQTKWRFIFYCDAHYHNAERDLLSILKERGVYRQYDVLRQPVFDALPNTLVKKGPWGTETNWFLNSSLWEDSIDLVYRQKDGTWSIAINNSIRNTATYIPVEHLKWSLPDEHHGLVDDFLRWLSN